MAPGSRGVVSLSAAAGWRRHRARVTIAAVTAPLPSTVCARPWVLIGCGFTGTRLARRLLAAGAEVFATRRSQEASRALSAALPDTDRVHIRALDLSAPGASGADVAASADAGDDAVVTALSDWIPPAAVIVMMAPPARAADGDEASGEARLMRAAETTGAARVVYVSSTGVYPPGDGSWVDEDTPAAPASSRGRARLAAERVILESAQAAGIAAVSLRAAGIYGPQRGVPTRLHRGTYRIIGPGDTYVSRIHVDDLGAAIVRAGTIEALPAAIFNAADDEPACSRPYADAVAEILGVPAPPSVPLSEVDPWIATMMRANRRIDNRRLKQQLGVVLSYPTWREGLRQVMAEEGIPGAAERSSSDPG